MKHNVLITGINGNVGIKCLEMVQRMAWDYTGIAREYKTDLSNWDDVWRFANQKQIDQEKFDLVIMAHGSQQTATLDEIMRIQYHDIIDNNLTSSAYLTMALKQCDLMNEGGLIIYFSSIQATQPRAGRFAYAIAKSGIEGLTRSAAVEFFENDVRCVGLRIGQMTKAMKGIEFTPKQMTDIEANIPLPLVSPESVAQLCFNLYFQKSITGTVIEISSGHNLNIWE